MKYSSKGRTLQRPRKHPVRIEVIVSDYVRYVLERRAEQENKTISGVASALISEGLGIEERNGRIRVRVRVGGDR